MGAIALADFGSTYTKLSLEEALDFIEADELLEVTPATVRPVFAGSVTLLLVPGPCRYCDLPKLYTRLVVNRLSRCLVPGTMLEL